jgi:hypothetical protein
MSHPPDSFELSHPSEKLDLRPFLFSKAYRMEWHQPKVVFDTPELVAMLDVKLQFIRSEVGFRVEGELEGVAEVLCQDCTGRTEVDVSETFIEHYVLDNIGKEKEKEQQVELLGEDFYEVVNPIHPFDVLDLVRQCTVVTLPYLAPCSYVDVRSTAPDACPNAFNDAT